MTSTNPLALLSFRTASLSGIQDGATNTKPPVVTQSRNMTHGLGTIFGLLGMAPAGILMALSAEAMRSENRSIGMGVFFMGQVLLQSSAPPVAGWLYDITQDVSFPILFAVGLFLATAAANFCFRFLKRRYLI